MTNIIGAMGSSGRKQFLWVVAVFVVLSLNAVCVFGDFDGDDVDDSFSLRQGDKTKCAEKVEFDGGFDELDIGAGEVQLDNVDCTGSSSIKLAKSPRNTIATSYISNNLIKDTGDFLAGNVSTSAALTCGTASIAAGSELIFLQPNDDVTITWKQLIPSGTGLAAGTGDNIEKSADLDDDTKYVIIGGSCFYEETGLSDRVCFPPSANVRMANGQHKRIDQLNIGDHVSIPSSSSSSSSSSNNDKTSRIIASTHADKYQKAKFVKAYTNDHGHLTATENHFVYAYTKNENQQSELIAMKNLKIGMALAHHSGVKAHISKIETFTDRGVYNPHTSTGTIIVDGFIASCYTTVIQPNTAHALLTPVRAAFPTLATPLLRSLGLTGSNK